MAKAKIVKAAKQEQEPRVITLSDPVKNWSGIVLAKSATGKATPYLTVTLGPKVLEFIRRCKAFVRPDSEDVASGTVADLSFKKSRAGYLQRLCNAELDCVVYRPCNLEDCVPKIRVTPSTVGVILAHDKPFFTASFWDITEHVKDIEPV